MVDLDASMPVKGRDWEIYKLPVGRFVMSRDSGGYFTEEQVIRAAQRAGYRVASNGRLLEPTNSSARADLFAIDLSLANSLIDDWRVSRDGQEYFDRSGFLDNLTEAIACHRFDTHILGDFRLNAQAVARYMWCCLCLSSGDAPGGRQFRSMQILE